RREQRAANVRLDQLERPRLDLRRERNHVGIDETLMIESRGPGGERLRRRRLFTGDRRLRDRSLLDRPYRLAGPAIEYVDEPLLADLHHGIDPPSIHRDRAQRRRRREVVVPQTVVHRLEMPDALAGRGVKADEA